MVNAQRDDRPTIGALISDASQQMSALVRDELELAKAELRESAKRAGAGGGMLGAAAGLGAVAFLLLSFAAVYGLVAAGLPVWAGFLIVAGVYLLVAAVLVAVGAQQLKKVRGPEQAIAEAGKTQALLKSVRGPGAAGGPASGAPAASPVVTTPSSAAPAPPSAGAAATP